MKVYPSQVAPPSVLEPELEGSSPNRKTPPAFQLTTSPLKPTSGPRKNGDGKQPGPGKNLPGGDQKKGIIPSNDYPATPGIQQQIKPTMVPEEIVAEIHNKIEGMEDLELCADVVIVHSPCYSAEIQAIMMQANEGEIDLKTAEKEILNRLTYLLTNEFKNEEGQVNNWAEEKKGDGTVANDDNMGADWYRMGESGGPQYMALTDWNDSSDPDQGANNYSIYRFDPTVAEQGAENPEYFQPFGNPLTSVNGTVYDKGPKATTVGNPIDVSILEILIGLFGSASTSKRGHNSEKAKDMRGPMKTGGENASAQHEKDVLDSENQDARGRKLGREKEMNTQVSVKYTHPADDGPWNYRDNYLTVLKHVTENPERNYIVIKTFPKNTEIPFLSKKECSAKFSAAKVLQDGSNQ